MRTRMTSVTAESMGKRVSPVSAITPPLESKLKQRLHTIWGSWAARSLAVGALATGIDLTIGISLNSLLHVETRPSAMAGSIVGSTFTYFANRFFAFREKNPDLASSMLKFIVVTALSSIAHGQLVVWLHDSLGWPFAVAKMLADVAIFTFAQLLVLRYIVFPRSAKKEIYEASGGSNAAATVTTNLAEHHGRWR